MGFPVGKCIFLQKDTLSYRKMHFPAEKCTFLHKNAVFGWHSTGNCRKLQEGFRAQESRTLANFHKNFCDLRLRCPSRTPEIARFPKQETAMMHCDLRVRWKVASDLRFRAAISEPKTPSCCGISGDLAMSMRTSLAIAIVRFWCAKLPLYGGAFARPVAR